MNCCCVPNGLDKIFGARQAQRDAAEYLKKGLDKPALRVVEVLKSRGVERASVLEIGAGVGGLHLELLKAGAGRAVDLDLSPAYLETARDTARKLGFENVVEHRLQDIAEESQSVAPADVVVMNRVICCYPHLERLLRPAAERAGRLLALTFPRDAWWARLGMRLANAGMWLTRTGFRIYVHPHEAVYAVASSTGLSPIHRSLSGFWQIAVFERAA
jgi:magnesium-protoporphyrin O-methyltransferase